jgi:hypothetical protein
MKYFGVMTIEYAARLMDEMRSNNEAKRRGFYEVESAPASRYSSVLNLQKMNFTLLAVCFLKFIQKLHLPNMSTV